MSTEPKVEHIELDTHVICLSYGVCVCILDRIGKRFLRSSRPWSSTTSRHVNQFIGKYTFSKFRARQKAKNVMNVTQEEINQLYKDLAPKIVELKIKQSTSVCG